MPKVKTHKGLAKRIKVTAGGKVKFNRPFTSHLMSSKNAKRRRQLRRKGIIAGEQARTVKRLLGQ